MILFRIASRNLLQAPRRSGLLGLAIAMVTGLLVLLLSASAGIEDTLIRTATQISSGHVTVAGFHKTTPTDAAPILKDAQAIREIVEQNTPGLDYLVDRQRGWAKIISETGAIQAGLTGIEIAQESIFIETIEIQAGSIRDLEARGGVVLFESQADKLGVGVGDSITIQTETEGGFTNTMDARVVAVARDLGLLSGWAVYLEKRDVADLYSLNDKTTGAIWVYLDDISQSAAVMEHLVQVFRDRGYEVMDHESAPFFFKFDTVSGEDWTGQKLDLTIWRDEVSFLTWVLASFDAVTWFISLILVSIIAVGIMNALWSAVRERTREIGTMRAIGMTRSRVLLLILLEAGLLGLVATTLGALVGAAASVAIDSAEVVVPVDAVRTILLSDTLHLSVRPGTLGLAIVALTTFTAMAALWPALRAARLKPDVAIRHVE